MAGYLERGVWHTGWYKPETSGAFIRPEAQFRSRITVDGSSEFRAQPGRYHLYVSYACPWAHRSLIVRALRGLEDAIGVTVVDPKMGDDGWVFSAEDPDPLYGSKFLRDLYVRAAPEYSGRVTTPVLWDREKQTIVCNESREVMRMIDTEFDAFAKNPVSLAPPKLRQRIDEVLDAIYSPINDGVYKTGFATTQGAYEKACTTLFEALDKWNSVLEKQRFLCGDVLTEADVALFTTLLRFDVVYFLHFKCNIRRVQDYFGLWGFARDVYQTPKIAETCRLDHIKTHYFWSHENINPKRIVPLGPAIDFTTPHGRERLSVSPAIDAKTSPSD